VADLPDDVELGGLLAQMQQLQASVARAEAEASARHVVGTAAGGAVSVRASGELSFDSVEIDPSVVDPSDVALLEDLVLAAVRDAAAKLTAMRREAMGGAVQSALEGLFAAGVEPPEDPPGPGELPE